MGANERLKTADILLLLEVPADGRVLTFGSHTTTHALEIAAARPDALIVACATNGDAIATVSERAVAERLDNIVVGDTPAGPLVDRALCVDGLAELDPSSLISLRAAILPGGYALFIESAAPRVLQLVERIRAAGYTVVDTLGGALAGSTVIRAR